MAKVLPKLKCSKLPMKSKSPEIWKRWRPISDEPWNLRRVVHLHRRAGFAATWREIQRDLADGPQAAVNRILSGQTQPDADHTVGPAATARRRKPLNESTSKRTVAQRDGVPADFAQMADIIGSAAVAANNPDRLKAWWVYRMLFSPDPLTERLALMWHNHFATSNVKVDDVALMRQQNDIFREQGRAKFGELLRRVVKHPALLVWLDAQANRKEHPNENLARELMELFTLGVGHYTEQDVKEAARALTGWTVTRGEFREVPQYHDDGIKTILGHTGKFNGDDLLDILLDHPATARRIA